MMPLDAASSGAVWVIARRIDLIRADLTLEMPPGRIASSISSTGASRTSSQRREPLAQRQIGDVPVAVVRRLRQHGQDQLGDRMAVGLGQRDPVHEPQPVADRAHPTARGRVQLRDARRAPDDSPPLGDSPPDAALTPLLKRAPPLARPRSTAPPPRAATPRPPTGSSPRSRAAPAGRRSGRRRRRSCSAPPPADAGDVRRKLAAEDRAVGAPSVITTIRAPGLQQRQRRAARDRPRRSSPRPRSALARTSSAPGTHAFAAAAASARERHRCSRRFGSNTTGRPSDSAASRARIVTSRSFGADQRVRAEEQRRPSAATAASSRPPSASHDGGDLSP